MKVKLITAEINCKPINIVGKPDRRFKSGWRVKPDLYVGYEIKLRLDNPLGRFRVHEIIITEYGKFLVTAIVGGVLSAANDPDRFEMVLTQCIAVERYVKPFIFNAEIDIMSGGYTVGESSTFDDKLFKEMLNTSDSRYKTFQERFK